MDEMADIHSSETSTKCNPNLHFIFKNKYHSIEN